MILRLNLYLRLQLTLHYSQVYYIYIYFILLFQSFIKDMIVDMEIVLYFSCM